MDRRMSSGMEEGSSGCLWGKQQIDFNIRIWKRVHLFPRISQPLPAQMFKLLLCSFFKWLNINLKLTTWDSSKSTEITEISTLRFISHRVRGVRRGICYWFWAGLPPQIHSEGHVLFLSLLNSSFLLVCPGTACLLPPPPHPVKTKQNKTNTPLLQFISLPLSSLVFLFVFLLIFFMEVKLSKRKFLQNSTQEYGIENSLTVSSILWWN